jgi:hypothetical protein
VPCPGYRREKSGLEFEDQTVVTVRRARQSYGLKEALVVKGSSNTTTLTSTPEVLILDLTRHAYQTWSTMLPPTTLFSPSTTRAQLYDKWLSIYNPTTTGMQGMHFDYLRAAISLSETEPALRHGLNTLALVQVGHATNDSRLLAASVPSYGAALAGLAHAVSKATSVRDNTVLAAASLLVVCEFYDQIKTQGMSWFGHVQGVQQLLMARGPASLDTDISLLLFCNARHGSLARSYLTRKGDAYDGVEWRAAAFRAPVNNWSVRLFDMTIRVPRFLQRVDEMDSEAAGALGETRELLRECQSLEAELRGWYGDYNASLRMHNIEAYTPTDVEEFKTFASQVTDRTLTTCYRFSNFMTGYLHSQYWIAMHYLRSTIKELRENRQSLDTSCQQSSPDDLLHAVTDEELNGYVFDLCRSIPHFVEPTSGTQGHIGIFLPLAVILMHFRSRQNWKWCLWGVNVKENVFNMGLRQPHVQEKDLPISIVRPKKGLSPFPNEVPPEYDEFVPTPEIVQALDTGEVFY